MNTEFDYHERNITILQELLEILKLSDVEEIPGAVKSLDAAIAEYETFAEQSVETLKTADELIMIAEAQSFTKGLALQLLGIDVYDITPEMVAKYPELSDFDAKLATALSAAGGGE